MNKDGVSLILIGTEYKYREGKTIKVKLAN